MCSSAPMSGRMMTTAWMDSVYRRQKSQLSAHLSGFALDDSTLRKHAPVTVTTRAMHRALDMGSAAGVLRLLQRGEDVADVLTVSPWLGARDARVMSVRPSSVTDRPVLPASAAVAVACADDPVRSATESAFLSISVIVTRPLSDSARDVVDCDAVGWQLPSSGGAGQGPVAADGAAVRLIPRGGGRSVRLAACKIELAVVRMADATVDEVPRPRVRTEDSLVVVAVCVRDPALEGLRRS